MARPQAADTASSSESLLDEPAGAPSRTRLLVFVAWCVWLLVWLVPSMVLLPRAAEARPWMGAETAPAAVLAAAALFLVAAWPFWPALAPVSPDDGSGGARRGGSNTIQRGGSNTIQRGGPGGPPRLEGAGRGGSGEPPRGTGKEPPRGTGKEPPRGGCGDPPRSARGRGFLVRLVGLSAMEAVVLGALAAPFLVAGRTLGGGRLAVWPTAATAAGLVVFGIGLRVAVAGMGGGAGRRLMAGALLLCGGPLAVCYAAAETLGGAPSWLPEVSPVVALVQAGSEGWPEAPWPEVARLWLWPLSGVGLGVLGSLARR